MASSQQKLRLIGTALSLKGAHSPYILQSLPCPSELPVPPPTIPRAPTRDGLHHHIPLSHSLGYQPTKPHPCYPEANLNGYGLGTLSYEQLKALRGLQLGYTAKLYCTSLATQAPRDPARKAAGESERKQEKKRVETWGKEQDLRGAVGRDWEKEKGRGETRTEIYLRMDKDLKNGGGG